MAISSINLSPNLIGTQISEFQAELDARRSTSASQDKPSGVIAQFSVFGQFQSSLADLQSRAQSLKNSSKPPTFQDLQVVVQGFVQSLNSLRESASRLASRQEASAAENRFAQAADGVRKVVDGDDPGALSALQKMGVSRQADGVFSVNDRQLGGLFQDDRSGALSAVSDMADRFVRAADKQNTSQPAPPIQGASVGNYAAGKAVASYAAVAAL